MTRPALTNVADRNGRPLRDGNDVLVADDEAVYVDFGTARGHEIHLPGGDCTTEIFQ